MKKKVMVGMSGGVDSSVSALLLKKMGYDVTGVTMDLKRHLRPKENELSTSLHISKDIADAKDVCRKIGIDHIVVDFSDIFLKEVINYFVDSYVKGLTPNPCVVCNKKVKFDALLKKAESLGFDFIATGHYVFKRFDDKLNRYLLYMSSSSKDQSYMLYNITQHQLKSTVFPLENMEKSSVRQIALENGLIVANKPDSQEICFIPDGDYAKFIERHIGRTISPGDFIDEDGNVLGKHKGIIHYTVGQRKGLGISFGKPMYVLSVDVNSNTVVLGEEKRLYSSCVLVDDVHFIPFDDLEESLIVDAKIRYKANPCKAKVLKTDGKIWVKFEKPQRAVTPGQSIVFYKGNFVVGGGVIVKSLS